MPRVNPEILTWARTSAGLSTAEAAIKLAISEDRLHALEAGEAEPSRRQLTNMATKYRRSLLVFYMPHPPAAKATDNDFRTVRGAKDPQKEALVASILRDIHARQELVSDALADTEAPQRFEYAGQATLNQSPQATANQISKALEFDREQFRNAATPSEAFGNLRAAAEELGIFVILMGNLGTHHSNVDAKTFRGFAILDELAPVIVVNETDSPSAWSFTLAHELAHMWLGKTGLSGYGSDLQLEKYCDEVAARFLLDYSELTALREKMSREELRHPDVISELSSDWNVSRTMVAFNLLRAGLIRRSDYQGLDDHFRLEREAAENERREQEAGRANRSGPDYYVVRKHRLGPGLVGTVRQLFSDGLLNASRAARVLGVKPTAVTRVVGISGQS